MVGAGTAEIAGRVLDRDFVRIHEMCAADQHPNRVPGESALDDVDLLADDVHGAGRQIGDGDVRLQPVRLPVQLTLIQTGHIENRLT